MLHVRVGECRKAEVKLALVVNSEGGASGLHKTSLGQ
jgi:hypothetical protein